MTFFEELIALPALALLLAGAVVVGCEEVAAWRRGHGKRKDEGEQGAC